MKAPRSFYDRTEVTLLLCVLSCLDFMNFTFMVELPELNKEKEVKQLKVENIVHTKGIHWIPYLSPFRLTNKGLWTRFSCLINIVRAKAFISLPSAKAWMKEFTLLNHWPLDPFPAPFINSFCNPLGHLFFCLFLVGWPWAHPHEGGFPRDLAAH